MQRIVIKFIIIKEYPQILFLIIFYVFYTYTAVKLYMASKGKVILFSFFTSGTHKFFCILAMAIVTKMVSTIYSVYFIGFSLFVMAVILEFLFYDTLKDLCKNKSYFMPCFCLSVLSFIGALIIIKWDNIMLFIITAVLYLTQYGLFAFALSKNESIKLYENTKS